ncbi:ABC transporter ATP-binding protein [Paenibacillaceae bacterium]|nr:ABC transporter ATP-binding protein [Paenibacillaceae bacterium]
MHEQLVQLTEVHKKIKNQTIVEALNLQVGQGQVVALCGENGAGKSTILRMLAGISQPTGGSIAIRGFHWKEQRKHYADQIGYMPDDYHFSAGLSASETMTFWAKLKGLSKKRAEEVLADVGLDHTGRKPVSSFSKGMRQRMLFGQALLARPPLLLLDEPTNGLDPYWMDSFVQLVRKSADDGQTVIFSTHQLHVAGRAADRILFLRGGVIEWEGTGKEWGDHSAILEPGGIFGKMYGEGKR